MTRDAPTFLLSRSFQRSTALVGALLLAACAQPDDEQVLVDGPGSGGSTGSVASSSSGVGSGAGGFGGGMGAGGEGGGGLQARYIYAHSDVELFRIDAATLGPNVVVEPVGKFNTDPDLMIDIAVTSDERIYGVTWHSDGGTSKLWEINKDTAAPTLIAEIPGLANVALTFDLKGTLLGADKGGRMFYVDPTNGATTDIGWWGNGFGASGDMVGVADGTLYGFADTGGSASEAINSLVKIDTVTGEATEVGLIGFDNLWGAAFWCGKVYAFRSDGDLLEIDVTTGKGTMLAAKIPVAQGGFAGAGVTPMAPFGTVGGVCD
jgi:hypothetical protein